MTAQFAPQESRPHRHQHHRKTNRLALASLAFGVVGVFAPAGLLAIVLGHISQIQIYRNRDRQRGRDVAKLGLILGYLGVAIFGVIMFGLRNPNYFSASKDTQTTASASNPNAEKNDPFYKAIKNRPALNPAERENKGVLLVKALQQAESNYKSAHPSNGYTCVLEDLFQSGFDESMLQLSIDTGYTISITDCTADAKGVRASYHAFATPPSGNGNLICSDQNGVIRASSNEVSNEACLQTGKPVAVQ